MGDQRPPGSLRADLSVRSSDALEGRDQARRKAGQWHVGGVAVMAVGVALATAFGLAAGSALRQGGSPDFFLLLGFSLGVVLLGATPMCKSRYRDWQRRLDDAEFEVDVERLDRAPTEAKADRLWRMNQRQILRYHEANLQQNAWALAVGIGCVLAGLLVVIVTMTLIARNQIKEPEITAIMGGIGAVLTNLVGAVSLRMYSRSVENLESFHDKLVGTQRLTMANVVAAQVEPDARRSETFAELATQIGISAAKESV